MYQRRDRYEEQFFLYTSKSVIWTQMLNWGWNWFKKFSTLGYSTKDSCSEDEVFQKVFEGVICYQILDEMLVGPEYRSRV